MQYLSWYDHLWVLDATSYKAIKEKVEASGNELKEMLGAKNKVAVLKRELSALSVEIEYFYTYYKETNEDIVPYRSLFRQNSEDLLALWLEYQGMAEKDNSITLSYKLKNLLRYGIYSFSFYKNSNEKVIAFFQKLYYELKIKELTEQIQVLTKRLESYQFDSAIKQYSENSMKLFKAKLVQRFSDQK